MQKVWSKIKELLDKNAYHRKGWRLTDRTARDHLVDAQTELFELGSNPDDIEELADVLACLMAYAQKKDWSCERVEEVILRKLDKRFIYEK